MAQLKCVRPYISLWWLDLKPLAGSCCPWAGRESLSAEPRPLHPFTNTEGSTLVCAFIPGALERFDIWEFWLLGVACLEWGPLQSNQQSTHGYFHIPSKNHPLDRNLRSVQFKNCTFLELQSRDFCLPWQRHLICLVHDAQAVTQTDYRRKCNIKSHFSLAWCVFLSHNQIKEKILFKCNILCYW